MDDAAPSPSEALLAHIENTLGGHVEPLVRSGQSLIAGAITRSNMTVARMLVRFLPPEICAAVVDELNAEADAIQAQQDAVNAAHPADGSVIREDGTAALVAGAGPADAPAGTNLTAAPAADAAAITEDERLAGLAPAEQSAAPLDASGAVQSAAYVPAEGSTGAVPADVNDPNY